MAERLPYIDNSTNPVEPTDLEFLTFTDFNQTTTAETRKKVRSHAQHQVQNKRRQEREEKLAPNSSAPSDASLVRNTNISLCRLGSGRYDPFTQYPIDMNLRTHELFDHLHGDTCPMFKTLNSIGFFKIVLDEAAFRQLLCTSSAHMTRLRDGTESPEAIVLSNQAIRSINNRITDPVLGISDGILISVLAFACHAVMFNDIKGTLTHFNGLEAIVQRRGGLQFLKSNPVLRTVIFWIDVNAAFLQDRVPRFPIPYDILPQVFSYEFTPLSGLVLIQICVTEEMTVAMHELLALNQFMVNKAAVGDLWSDAVFAGLRVVPLLSKLLTIRHNSCNPALIREESCRIGAILYLSGIRRRFGVALIPDIHIQNLKHAMAEGGSDDANPILTWLLIIGGTQSTMHEEREWFVSEIANLIFRFQYDNWEELLTLVRDVLWVEGILEAECDKLRTDVSIEAWSKYGHLFS